ncbi:hypothetical protein RIF29_19340 [Crotalaria pallida]|uniref:Uncharacterized protein n=1 Tax=Crotalaria pallida TaxID=3830 RepID=A0AAN9F1K5_CROPI
MGAEGWCYMGGYGLGEEVAAEIGGSKQGFCEGGSKAAMGEREGRGLYGGERGVVEKKGIRAAEKNGEEGLLLGLNE